METSPETVEYLDLGNLVNKMPKKSGGKVFLVPRLFIEKIRNKWRKMKLNLKNFVGEKAVNEKVETKEEKVEKKIESWEDYQKEIRTDLRNVISNEEKQDQKELNNVNAAMSYAKERIEKLKQKKVKVNKKGLGIFALSALAVKKIADNGVNKVKKFVSDVKEERTARKRAKEEDKAIKEYNKRVKKAEKSERVQPQNSDELTDVMKQILEQLKRLNANLESLGYQQEVTNTK